MKFIIGLAVIAVGALMVMKTEAFLNVFGRIGFFDKYLGSEGGSRLGYKIIGMLAAFIGTLVVTGLFNGFMYWLLGPIIRVSGG